MTDRWEGPGTGKEPASARLAALGFSELDAARINATDPPGADVIVADIDSEVRKIESGAPLRYAVRAGRRLGRLLDGGTRGSAEDDEGDE